jgi:tetratricopeptide (TPR) repeat protein
VLGIFLGRCTLEAVATVGWEADLSAADDVLATIAALVDASLIQVDMAGDAPPRYHMLAVMREYASEQLRAAGEEERYQQRHARYYADLAEEAERFSPGKGTREMQLEQESANGRAALHWAAAQGETPLGLRLATGFGLRWLKHGRMREAELWLEQMLALDAAAGVRAAPPTVRSRALYAAAQLALNLGKHERATALAGEELVLAQRTGDQADISKALTKLGTIALATGKEDQAATYFTKSYAAANRAGDEDAQSLALLNLGEIARKRGDVAHATEFLEACLALVLANEMTWGIANALTLLGHLARQQQEYEQAKVR